VCSYSVGGLQAAGCDKANESSTLRGAVRAEEEAQTKAAPRAPKCM
jgi:hypothetical protein